MTSPKKAEWEQEFDKRFLQFLEHHREQIDIDTLGVPLFPKEVKNFIRQTHTDLLTELRERVEGMRKEQLDKNDPDNYGACYAIAGFNDALSKTQALINSILKNKNTEA